MRLSLFVDLGLEVITREGRVLGNSRQEIHRVTQGLLPERPRVQIVALLFLAHPSITAAFPAEGARLVGWTKTPLLCLQAPDLPELTIKVVALCAPPGTWVGVRGANTVKRSTEHALVELLSGLQQKNPSLPISSKYIITTVTSDLEEETAATALQILRWETALSDSGIELNVSSIPKVVRVLIISQSSEAATHVFLHETAQLRPDLGLLPPGS